MPMAVSRLQLARAFRGFARNVRECIETTTDAEFAVADDETRRYSTIVPADTEDKCCHIHNPERSEIVLLAIDNRLICNHARGIADCAVFNTLLFRLIEFKTNAMGTSGKAVSDTYQKAADQLKETLQLFTEKERAIGIDLHDKTETECHIIINHTFPRSRTSEQTMRLAFAEETGTPLYFGNEITF